MGYLLKLFTGNPVTMIYVALAIFAVGLGLGTTGGWTLNGWRLGAELEQTKKERDLAIGQGKVLATAAEACSASVDHVAKLAVDAVATSRALLEEAKRLAAGGQKQIARIEELLKDPTPAGAGCNEAWQKILETWKAGAP